MIVYAGVLTTLPKPKFFKRGPYWHCIGTDHRGRPIYSYNPSVRGAWAGWWDCVPKERFA